MDHAEGVVLIDHVLGGAGIDHQIERRSQSVRHLIAVEVERGDAAAAAVFAGVIVEAQGLPERLRRFGLALDAVDDWGVLLAAEIDRCAAEKPLKLGEFRLRTQERVRQLLGADLDDAGAIRQVPGTAEIDQIQDRIGGRLTLPLAPQRSAATATKLPLKRSLVDTGDREKLASGWSASSGLRLRLQAASRPAVATLMPRALIRSDGVMKTMKLASTMVAATK